MQSLCLVRFVERSILYDLWKTLNLSRQSVDCAWRRSGPSRCEQFFWGKKSVEAGGLKGREAVQMPRSEGSSISSAAASPRQKDTLPSRPVARLADTPSPPSGASGFSVSRRPRAA